MHILHLNQRNQRNQILFQYLRDKKKKRKKGTQKKGGGGENSPISPPLDPRLKSVFVVQDLMGDGRRHAMLMIPYELGDRVYFF